MIHFVDDLLAKISAKGAPICVGIDPVYDRLPAALRADRDPADARQAVDAIHLFIARVLRVIAPHAPCVKFQSACFERYLTDGLRAYHDLVRIARSLNLSVIGDVKRGDIGPTASHYAAGCLLDSPFRDHPDTPGPDSITINTYFGLDGLKPFLDAASGAGKGLFTLVRTSNPGGDAIQALKLADGRTVAQAVAMHVSQIGEAPAYVGKSGYSLLGAVVGATKPAEAADLRKLMPRQMFLVPGFGAQGAGADDVKACFKPDGTGALITASRSITYAFEDKKATDWAAAIEEAVVDMKNQIRAITG